MDQGLQVKSTLRLVRREKVFGPGIAALLEGVGSHGSLRKSAMELGMSYNKAWHVVRECEKELGFALLRRHAGGVGGGGAELTPEGAQLLGAWRAFEGEAKAALDQLAEKYFAGGVFPWENR